MSGLVATAPGKLILTGEYAVLDGAPALVVAVDRRAIARIAGKTTHGSSPFLLALASELASRRGADDPAAATALRIAVDSSAFYDGTTKLGLGSSAAVTVAATARALAEGGLVLDREELFSVALAAHANAQGARGARGSGADVAAAVHGGTLAFTTKRFDRRLWPASVRLLPFFTGRAADTATLVARVAELRKARRVDVEAALTAVADASQAACAAIVAPSELVATAMIAAFTLGAHAIDRLAAATGLELVPECVRAARSVLGRLGGTAKTTGAGGGDVAIGLIPATADLAEATRGLIEAGCQPLQLSVDETGVDLRAAAS